MSYVIKHRLSWDSGQPTKKEMMAHIAVALGTRPRHAESIATGEERHSWNHREEHLASISKKWPETTITVHCQGEDHLAWTEFYQHGKTYSEDHHEPEFDPTRLK